MFQKATRKKVKLKMAISGPSGSGKTYSSLILANCFGKKVALIDTENRSSELFSDEFSFDVYHIDPPFTVEKYIEAINLAVENNYDILIIDSLSHAWNAEGGILERHLIATEMSPSKNSYMAWNKITPLHNKLINTILQSNIHVIACMRSKVAYEVTSDENNKKKPVKIGLTPIQREGIDFEFAVMFELSNNYASATKDRTKIFKDKTFVISEDTGKKIIDWLNKGIDVQEDQKKTFEKHLNSLKNCKNLIDLKKKWTEIYYNVQSFPSGLIKKLEKQKDNLKLQIEKGEYGVNDIEDK